MSTVLVRYFSTCAIETDGTAAGAITEIAGLTYGTYRPFKIWFRDILSHQAISMMRTGARIASDGQYPRPNQHT